ncbi:MAG: 3-keto-disaccharide hydrolase [Anaerohalosphaeraceae bacterium]|jgi:hypothetical protein
MKGKAMKVGLAVLILAVLCTVAVSQDPPRNKKTNGYFVHDEKEPAPPVVKPGDKCGQPPSDAIVIFDGTSTENLCDEVGNPTKWIINDEGALECTRKAGTVRTKQEFGSIQLHIEWATPKEVSGSGQGRGNSGVFLQGTYELQVLDSYNNPTYADGQAGAIYGQKKPLVNVCRAPGEWQTYDVIYHRPIFKGRTNEVVRPATITVFHNGVLVQDNWPIKGITYHKQTAEYKYHPDKMPLKLQDHGNPIRYRNIWVREIDDIPATE